MQALKIASHTTQQWKVQRIERDAVAALPTNIESKMFPGLVCTDAKSLILAEQEIVKARDEGIEEVSLPGDIVYLPDDIGDMFSAADSFICRSKFLMGLPASLWKVPHVNCAFPEYTAKWKARRERETHPLAEVVKANHEAVCADTNCLHEKVSAQSEQIAALREEIAELHALIKSAKNCGDGPKDVDAN